MALENKSDIENSADLAREEERISKRKAMELFESGMSAAAANAKSPLTA